MFNTILDRLLLEKEAETDSESACVDILDNLVSECTQFKTPLEDMVGHHHLSG